MMRPMIGRPSRHAAAFVSARRTLITVPSISYIDSQKERGIPGLYSPKGLQSAWYDLSTTAPKALEEGIETAPNRASLTHAVDEERQKGSEAQLESLIKAAVTTPDSYGVFNLASRLYNSYFAISSLIANVDSSAPVGHLGESALFQNPSIATEFKNSPRDFLHSWIVDSFGSIVEFRTLLLNSNLAIKGNGYTWLVARGTTSSSKFDKLFVVNTYNGGSPNFQISSGQIKALDQQLKQKVKEQEQEKFKGGLLDPASFARLPTVEEARFQTMGLDESQYLPLLAINGSPHAYLPDYGVFGKKQYLENVWNSIDWKAVNARLPTSNYRPNL